LQVARPLGHSRWQQALGTEFLPGETLDSRIGDDDYPGASIVAPVGEALAELHAQSGAEVRPPDPNKAAAALLELAGWIGFVCPSAAASSRALASDLVSALAQLPAEIVPTHGDFYASQVLLDGDDRGRVGLLDLDEACTGERWADLGNFAAHLESDTIRGHVPANRLRPLIEALNASYCGAAAQLLSQRVTLHTAAALFRLAPHPFRRREANWPSSTRKIVGRAAELLELYRGHR
jgi:Ser/Thr protein kinase RdoA (MazF antagonist)